MIPVTIEFKTLRTFVPAKNFEISRRFYQRLGFNETPIDAEMVLLQLHGFEFYLQNYYVKDWANNFMMLLGTSPVDEWWAYLQSLELEKEFKGIRLVAPVDEGWAKVCRLIDPSGVLWHFAG